MKIAMVMHKRIERKLRLSAHWECHKFNATWFMCRRFKVRDTILYAYLCNHCLYSELLFDEGVSKDEIDQLEELISEILEEELSELQEFMPQPDENNRGMYA